MKLGLWKGAIAGLFQPKLATNTDCLSRVIWENERGGDGEQLSCRNNDEMRSLRQQKVA